MYISNYKIPVKTQIKVPTEILYKKGNEEHLSIKEIVEKEETIVLKEPF